MHIVILFSGDVMIPYKKILVTGGCGFIGSHLVKALLKTKSEIYATDINKSRESYFYLEKLASKCSLIIGDVRKYKFLQEVISRHKINFIFHLAAQTQVTTAFEKPKDTLETNILGTVNILEIARACPYIKGVVIASSDKAYGKKKSAYMEDDPLVGDHPYEVSKSAADLLSRMYFKTYGLPVVTTRFANVYGEGDLNFERLIPGIMKSVVLNKNFYIRSNGRFIRSYLYINDVVRGYLMLMKNLDKIKGEAFNFGSPDIYSVLELLHLFEKSLDKKINYKIINNQANEIPKQVLNYRKIKRILNWQPEYSIVETIKGVYNWYLENLKS